MWASMRSQTVSRRFGTHATDRLVDILHIETEQSTLFFCILFCHHGILKISYRFSGWNGCPCMRFGTLRLNRFSANSATTSSFNKLDM